MEIIDENKNEINNKNNNDNISKLNENNNNDIIINKNIDLKKEERYNKCENMYNLIINGKLKTNRSKSVLNDFLKERGYKNINKLRNKDNVLNANRIKNISNRNLIIEEYKIRSNDNGKTPFNEQQNIIIHKNIQFNKKLEHNEFEIKKLICEKDINKEDFEL